VSKETPREADSLFRRISVWGADGSCRQLGIEQLPESDRFPWFELTCGSEHVAEAFAALVGFCPGLTEPMLSDLLTPDDQPEGIQYSDGAIRLASSFEVSAPRRDGKTERGTAQGAGVLVFQPVELLASDEWLLTCWHPRRTFRGALKTAEGPPQDADELHLAVARRWGKGAVGNAADLGIAVMFELSLSYVPAYRALFAWLEDWELSLYLEDELDNHDELPMLWGLMAVLRDWLSPLNKAGLRVDTDKAWLPATHHQAVIEVDDRVDRALDGLARLSETLRQSFGLVHLGQAEKQREHSERNQHRLEAAAAVLLVPTLIVGFYGANTWVPGQGRHWGFWVMVVVLVLLSALSLLAVLYLQRRSHRAARAAAAARRRLKGEVLRGSPPGLTS
jgi:hypothetical protein